MHGTLEKSPAEMVLERSAHGLGGRWYGIFPGLVSDIKDPNGTGRVKVTLPWAPDTGSDKYETWARVATLMGGNNRGSWFVPDVNDEVLLGFEAQSMDGAGQNNLKVLRSRNGVKVTLDDQNGQEKFIAETPGGQKITMQDGPGSIEIADSNGNFIKLESSGITVNASAKVTVTASQAEITASMVTVNAPIATFSGTVQAQTVICSSIISASYTPGAGNMW